ncbi:MAG: crossover junction endodeoxyribonuclease RuvC [Elusimicrobiota bacterium]
MRILGIDPGSAILGWGIIESVNDTATAVDYGVITTPKKCEIRERLTTIYSGVERIIQKFNPDTMAIEKLFFNKNVTTAMAVSESRGVAILAAAKIGICVCEYTPLQVKKALTGYGIAEKQQVQKMIQLLLRLKELPKPDDAADALAIALCCLSTDTFTKAVNDAENKL